MTDEQAENLLCHLYQVFYGDLDMCGCYMPQAAVTLVYELLRITPYYEDRRWKQAEALAGGAGSFQLLISMLTNADLMVHSSSLGGSSATDRGRWVVWAVEQLGGPSGLGDRLDEVGYPHDADEQCTDACWRVSE
ncbi:hypothetical protein [Kitasatospora sp. NPDC001683]